MCITLSKQHTGVSHLYLQDKPVGILFACPKTVNAQVEYLERKDNIPPFKHAISSAIVYIDFIDQYSSLTGVFQWSSSFPKVAS